jgi:predicted transposase YdaD
LEEAFRQDITTYQRGKNMPYISTIERMGEARGKVEGKVEGKIEMISFLFAQQVGTISTETIEELKKLPIEQLDQLALDLRGFTNSDDLTNWITQRNASSRP